MSFDFKNKIVLITGGASGLGASVAKALLNEDVKLIVIIDIAEEAGSALKEELNSKYGTDKVKFIKCDVTDYDKLRDVFREVKDENGTIDVVINSAGIFDESLSSCLKIININLTALIMSNRESWEMMRKDKGGLGGTIINMGSVAALCKSPFIPVYGATKAAVLKFGVSLGNDLHYSKSGVRVITTCFGLTNTPLINNYSAKCFDSTSAEVEEKTNFKTQSPESAVKGIIEAYKEGKSGSVWIITNDKPAVDVTDVYNKNYEAFEEYIFN